MNDECVAAGALAIQVGGGWCCLSTVPEPMRVFGHLEFTVRCASFARCGEAVRWRHPAYPTAA